MAMPSRPVSRESNALHLFGIAVLILIILSKINLHTLPAYKAATRALKPITRPALQTQLLTFAAAPLSLTGALGVAVPFEMVPLFPGRPEE